MAYAAIPEDLSRQVAAAMHQILSGAKAGDIPVYQPTRLELSINLSTAKALDLTISGVLLAGAYTVIE